MDTPEILAIVAENNQLKAERRQFKKRVYDLENEVKRLSSFNEQNLNNKITEAAQEAIASHNVPVIYRDGYIDASLNWLDIHESYQRPLYIQITVTQAIISQVKGILSTYPDGLSRKPELIDLFETHAIALGDELNRLDLLDRKYLAGLSTFIKFEEGESAVDITSAIEFRDHISNFVTGDDPNGMGMYMHLADNKLLLEVMSHSKSLKSRDRKQDKKTVKLANSYAFFERKYPHLNSAALGWAALVDTGYDKSKGKSKVKAQSIRTYVTRVKDRDELRPQRYNVGNPEALNPAMFDR